MNSIIQWNLQCYRTQFSELKRMLNNQMPLCVCLQETMKTALYPPSSYTIVCSTQTRDDGHERGTAILVSRRVQYSTVTLNTNLQAVAVTLYLDRSYTVCSLYLPHVPIIKRDVENLIDQLPPPFLLLGDMNAHSPIWGSSRTNQHGQVFEDIMQDRPIYLLSTGEPTYYHVQTGTSSCIDLSFTSIQCSDDFEYRIMDDLHGSDHFPIAIIFKERPNNITALPRFKIRNADWSMFKRLTQTDIDPNVGEIDDVVERVCEKIMRAAEESIPKTSGNLSRPPMPWWTRECADAVRARVRAERAMKRRHTEANKIRYKRAKAIARFTLNNARRKSWQEYVGSINQRTTLHNVWKKVQKIKGKYQPTPTPALIQNGGNITNPEVVSNILASHFASVSSDENYTETFQRYRRAQEERQINFNTRQHYPYNDHITATEMKYALSSTTETSPGEDGITYSMIKHVHQSMSTVIIKLFNRIYIENTFPTKWRISIIIAILKNGKDPKLSASYRPISLTNCLCKLMEKIINYRLMWLLETQGVISKYQSGFRRNRGTIDNLTKFQTDVQAAIENKSHTIAIFFDIEKAYDTAWRHGILMKLQEYGLRGHLPMFIANFLTNRQIKVRLGNIHSDLYEIQNGIPQGSVLSCTCFLIAMNDIGKYIPQGISQLLYVDDFTIYASGANTTILQRRLQMALNSLKKWNETTGFKFSALKTKSIHICRRRNCPKLAQNLSIQNHHISCVDSIVYLGMTIDNSLIFAKHIQKLKTSCIKTLQLFWKLANSKWGSDSPTLKQLYIMLLKPKIEYGLEAYAAAAPSHLTKVNTMENSALRIATGAFKSSPISSLHVLTATIPQEYSMAAKHINFLLRTLVNPSHPMNELEFDMEDLNEELIETHTIPKSFLNRTLNMLIKYNINISPFFIEGVPESPPWHIDGVGVCQEMMANRKGDTPHHILKNMFEDHLQEHSESLIVYTDGSKSEDGVGFACYSSRTTSQRHIPSGASNYTAELLAIMEAINLSSNEPFDNITIVTDSKSSIQAIASLNYQHPIVNSIRHSIITGQKRITLCWVPSHVGVLGNERADELARNSIGTLPISHVSLPRSDIKCDIKRRLRIAWQQQWDAMHANKLHEIIPLIPKKYVDCYPRSWSVTLNRLKLGHTRLTHGHYMSGSPQPFCEDCIVPLTIKHIMVECPNYNQERVIFGNVNLTMARVFESRNCDVNGILFNFLRNIDITNEI